MTAILACALIMLVLHLLTPYWWWVMIVPFAYGAAAAKSGWKAIRTGFFAAGLLWLGGSLYFFLTGSGIIAGRVAKMFGLGGSWLMIPVTALVAAAFSGYAIRAIFKKKATARD